MLDRLSALYRAGLNRVLPYKGELAPAGRLRGFAHALRLAFSVVAITALSFTFATPTHAATQNVNMNVEPYVTVNLSGDGSTSLDPGRVANIDITARVLSNNPTGYNLAMNNTSTTESAMVAHSNASYKIPVSNSAPTADTATWSVRTPQVDKTETWHAIPLKNAEGGTLPVGSNTTMSANAGDNYHTIYGISATGNTPADTYSATVEYTATANPLPVKPVGNSVCKSGDSTSGCQVDIDANMIPIKYTGNETKAEWKVADPTKAGWYDYGNKQWANAVTVKADKLATYKGKVDTVVNNDDVLGYWVYIPRYAYEVMRRDATDKVVPAENFSIYFEKATDIKKVPAKGCSVLSGSTLDAKDYRTGCNISRDYGNATGTTWATHPAFTWGNKELNGIWVAKFETTGSQSALTVKPSESPLVSQVIGLQYDEAKSIGAKDTANTYGNGTTGLAQDSHNLAIQKSHMTKDSEWGAAAYLSASQYGTGVNNVKINSYYIFSNGTATFMTGCGPQSAGSEDSGSTCNAYNTTLGQTASTTGNTTGVYDMSGGVFEYTMGNRTTSDTASTSDTKYVTTQIAPPYVDLYKTSDKFGTKPAWSSTTSEYFYNFDVCTFESCGGRALHEIKTQQPVTVIDQSWGGDGSNFPDSDTPWVVRGAYADYQPYAGVFSVFSANGGADGYNSFRVVLSGV